MSSAENSVMTHLMSLPGNVSLQLQTDMAWQKVVEMVLMQTVQT